MLAITMDNVIFVVILIATLILGFILGKVARVP